MSRSDTFTRADSLLTINSPSDAAGDYTVAATTVFGIASNTGQWVSGFDTVFPTAVLESSSAVVDFSVDYPAVGADAGVVIRYVDASNFNDCFVRSSGNTLQLHKIVAGAFTSLGTFTGAIANGDTIKVTVSAGNVYNVFQNGTLRIGPVTDAANSTGTKHGLATNSDATVRWDNLVMTTPGAVSAPSGFLFHSFP